MMLPRMIRIISHIETPMNTTNRRRDRTNHSTSTAATTSSRMEIRSLILAILDQGLLVVALALSLSYSKFLLRHVHRLQDGYGTLEYQYLPFGRLDEDLIGIVAFHNAGNWLASGH